MLSLSRRALWNPSVRRASAALRPFSAASPAEKFNQAVKDLNNVPEEPSNDVKLQLYALFKQATVGKCNVAKPGTFDFVGKAKWDAWYKLGDMSQDDAQNEYAAIVTKLAGEKASGPAQSQEPATAASSGVEGLVTTFQDGAFTIRFNRPSKRNSITLEMYEEVIKLLKDAGQRDDVKFLVLTGTGEFFSSGNDLGNFAKQMQTGRSQLELAKEAAELVRRYVAEFINFPKPAMALINGPSIGVSCTILGLFDLVYASDKAFFQTPFTQLGLSPEGCSSYTFPRIMGIARVRCEAIGDRALERAASRHARSESSRCGTGASQVRRSPWPVSIWTSVVPAYGRASSPRGAKTPRLAGLLHWQTFSSTMETSDAHWA